MNREIWWRDDDAGRDDVRLERLLALARKRDRPVALAVVPEWLEPATVRRILACPLATVLQHGVAHEDHGGAGGDKVELGGEVDRDALAARLVAGRERLADAFGDRFLPVLVPPWNRIDADVTAMAPALGFTGLSCFAGPPRDLPLRRIDVHVDAVDWPAGAVPLSADAVETALDAAFAAATGGPVGLMTHHQVLEERHWDDLDRVLGFGQDDAAVVWLAAAEAFATP
mgnify:CR=1 FL=1